MLPRIKREIANVRIVASVFDVTTKPINYQQPKERSLMVSDRNFAFTAIITFEQTSEVISWSEEALGIGVY